MGTLYTHTRPDMHVRVSSALAFGVLLLECASSKNATKVTWRTRKRLITDSTGYTFACFVTDECIKIGPCKAALSTFFDLASNDNSDVTELDRTKQHMLKDAYPELGLKTFSYPFFPLF